MTPDAPPTPHADDERVSTIGADRLCASCGYNLIGQSVVREPHYKLLIARCPECGEAAALQEYPSLGAWVSRLTAVLAVVWVLVLLGALAGSIAAITAFPISIADEAGRQYRWQIDGQWDMDRQHEASRLVADFMARQTTTDTDDVTTQSPGMQIPDGTVVMQQADTSINRFDDFGVWWSDQDPEALLAAMGGRKRVIDRRALWILIPFSLTALVVGMFWSAALITRRRIFVLALLAFISVISLGFMILAKVDLQSEEISWARAVMWREFSGSLIIPAGLIGVAFLMIGGWFGRPILRGLVRAMLPPRLRGSLAILWLADGKKLPARNINEALAPRA